jgi:hypothetical protein
MAIVNSEQEADIIRLLYLNYGPLKVQRNRLECEIPETENPLPEPNNAIVHIGFHDMFIEDEYLTVCSK